MNNETNNSAFSHSIILTVFSVFGALLLYNIYITDSRNNIAIPIIAMALISMWIIHLIHIGSDILRLSFYASYTFVIMTYFGIRPESLTDMPIILCVFSTVMAFAGNTSLMYIVNLSFIADIFYHIFVTHYLYPENCDISVYSRLILGILCLICSVEVSRYVITKYNDTLNKLLYLKSNYDNTSKENERILSGLSHELRTPINAINGLSTLLAERKITPEIDLNISTINQAGKRLGSQVDDVLDYSEIISNKLIASSTDYSIVSTVNDALSELSIKGSNTLDVVTNIQTDIPCLLSGDEAKIKRIIKALLSNAILYTPKGGVLLKVSKRSTEYGINLLIDVYDTGVGMTQNEINEVLSLIRDTDRSTDHVSKGLGIGLIIVHGLVSSMKGFLSIKPQPAGGLHVNVTIPQLVRDHRPSITLSNPGSYNIAYYINRDKFEDARVANYYDELFESLKAKLNLDITATKTIQQLKDYSKIKRLSHCFVGVWEYYIDPDFYNELSQRCCVCLIAVDAVPANLPETIRVINSPIFVLPILNILNATDTGIDEFLYINRPDYKKHIRALVVDDEKMNLLVAEKILNDYGIEVIKALSGMEAIEKCSIGGYDIIFLDHMMTGMDGIETLESIRKLRHGAFLSVPIVALTATAVSGARDMFIKKGFDDFIPKPIEQTTMTRVLRRLLGKGGMN